MLLSTIALGLAYNSRQSVQSVGSLVAGAQARSLAQGGIQLVLANLLNNNKEARLPGDGEAVFLTLPGGQVEVIVSDESGKININAANSELLSRFFVSIDIPEDEADALADAVIDYRDEDNLVGLHGAEDKQYQAADLPWEAKDAAFTNTEELQQVYGMEPWMYRATLPNVTIYSPGKGVDPLVASLQVLLALSDESLEVLENYVHLRRENHVAGLILPEPPVIDREFLSRSRSTTFTIAATGQIPGGQRSSILTTVRLKRGQNSEAVETLSWQPYRSLPLDNIGQSDGRTDNNRVETEL
jgi:general secretion pathway protein K